MATSIASLFTPPEDILAAQQQQNQARQAAISQQGSQFGIFAPLYQAGLRNIDAATQALFPTQDPRLQRATMIQGVLSKYQDQDMTDPTVLGNMSRDFASMGFSREAMTLAEDARVAKRQAAADARAERTLQLSEESAKDTRYKNNPELILRDALALPENDPTRTALLTRYSQITEDKNYSTAQKQADLAKARADLAKTNAETERIKAITNEMATDAQGNNVNNNGVRIGKFDKVGRYKAPSGEVYTAKAMEDARASHDAASDLLYKIGQVTDDDVKNAFGSATDWTTVPGGGLVASTKTYNAQTKINSIQIQSVLNNLSKLKGPSSDKEMAQMIKDFPGYNADPDVMRAWANRAVEATNRFLKRSENRYGFDTDYGVEGRFKLKGKKETTPTDDWSVLSVTK